MTAAVLSDLINGQQHHCRLCFIPTSEDSFNLQDEVFVDLPHNQIEELESILNHVLGGKFMKEITLHDNFCSSCVKSAISSYSFIKMCQSNCEWLVNSVNCLHHSLENCSQDTEEFKSLFVHIKTTTKYTSKQYYDNQKTAENKNDALIRFKSLIKSKYTNKGKERKSRSHNYSQELSEICKVIKEGTHSTFECRVCSAIFKKTFNLKKHYYSQHAEKHFKCTECNRSYGSETLLKQHKYDSHASIVCSQCGKMYKNRYSLLYHARQHSGEYPYECHYCGMKFQWSSRRAEHVRRYHLEPSVECNICHVKFRSLGSLYDHRKRHFNPNSRLHIRQEIPLVEQEVTLDCT